MLKPLETQYNGVLYFIVAELQDAFFFRSGWFFACRYRFCHVDSPAGPVRVPESMAGLAPDSW